MSQTPIYDQVCEDLKVFPRAIKMRDHRSFMRDHQQSAWLERASAGDVRPARRLHSVRKPRKR